MAARRGLIAGVGIVLAALGTLGAMSGSAFSMVMLFAGLILIAVGIDRG